MDQEKNNSETWVDSAAILVEAYRNLITIRVVDHTSLGISISIVGILSLIVAVFVLLFTGLGSAWWLGESLSNMKAGFFIVGGVYTVVFIILVLTSRKVLVPRIRNLIIKNIYDQD
jgi:hypothetical protein